jgi:spore germination protein
MLQTVARATAAALVVVFGAGALEELPAPSASAMLRPPVTAPRVVRHTAVKRSRPSATAAEAHPMVLGYYVPGPAAWYDLVVHWRQITAIAPFWYSFRPTGPLHRLNSNTRAITAWAHAHGVAVYPLVINGYGNDLMLQNPARLRTDVSILVRLAASAGYNGFNVDFESLNNPDEAGLDTFVTLLAAGLHREGKKLIVSVGPRTSDYNGYHVYNYRLLGQAADYVDLMLYDDHDNGGSAGPVAPLDWVIPIIRYAAVTIPAPKILVGLAGYGYNWAADGSTEVNDYQALALARRYGSTWVGGGIDEARIQYTDASGYTHIVWFEDSTSELHKVALANQYHAGGVALWDLGEENSGVWPMLARNLH